MSPPPPPPPVPPCSMGLCDSGTTTTTSASSGSDPSLAVAFVVGVFLLMLVGIMVDSILFDLANDR